jgi:glycosyltransferase involved in cell wall biosynthesis
MKLIIQIPCLNEEETLPLVLADLPRTIEGIDEIRTLVIDDGSTDSTAEVAERLGVDYIITNERNVGLARSFSRGMDAALFLGADIIVNTDGDNQYKGSDVRKLVEPILEKRADVVIGCRDIGAIKEFSTLKKMLQRMGSHVVRRLSGTDIPDTTSGFRAMTRASAIRLSIMSGFSYTLEMLIQAGRTGLKVDWVPIGTNPKTRDSRLFRSSYDFVKEQVKAILFAYIFYCPLRFFSWFASVFLAISIIMAVRIAYFLWLSDPAKLKFKTGSGVLLLFSSVVTVLFFITGLLGAVLSGLRVLMIDIRSRLRNVELQQNLIPFDLNLKNPPRPADREGAHEERAQDE